MIDEKALAEYEAMGEAATPGPWAWESVSHDGNEWCLGLTHPAREGEIVESYNEKTGVFDEKPEVVESVAESIGSGSFADAAFIAASRTMGPALCAALRAERATVVRLREALTKFDALANRLRESGTGECRDCDSLVATAESGK